MRKLLILIFAVTFTACNAPAEQVGAGFFTGAPGEKYVVGSDDTVSYTHLTLPTIDRV